MVHNFIKSMFFISVFILMVAGTFYVLHHLWHMLPAISWLRWTVSIFGVLALLSGFVSVFAGDDMPIPVTSALYRIGTSWLFILLYMVMIFLLLDLIKLTNILPLRKLMYDSWVGSIGLTILVLLIFVGANVAYHDKKRVEFSVDTGGKLERPVRIVAVSDLHLGYGIGNRELATWIRMINAEQPDIILIAGDVIDNSVKPLRARETANVLSGLRSEYGVYVVPGNHEYIAGMPEALEWFRDAGLCVLRDSSVLVDGSLYIVGRDDLSRRSRKSLHDITASLDPAKPVVVLDHQPSAMDDAIDESVLLQISGHTHHGQVWPISLITDAIFDNAYGLQRKNNTYIYVSSGLGIWGGKFRIGTRSEYVVITLR